MAEGVKLQFVDEGPPESTRNTETRQEVEAFVEALEAAPGKWALLYEDLKSSTASARGRMLREYDGISTAIRSGSVYAGFKIPASKDPNKQK